jgi:DNA-binding CsgD family transcriptional regulator
MFVDDINYAAFDYNRAILTDLVDICEPILKGKITGFAYLRFLENGRYLNLCTDLKWTEHCLKYVHDHDHILGREGNKAMEDNFHCFLWPTISSDHLLNAVHDFDFWHGISIFKRIGHSLEIWAFATSRENHLMSNFYLNNIETIKDFIKLFNQKAKNIIDTNNCDKLGILKNAIDYSTDFNDHYISKQINQFLSAIDIKKYPLITQNKEIFLSVRENQCLNHLAFGKTAKEIGKELNISNRAIELYLKNIKNKLGCNSKFDMISIYKKSYRDWF